MSRKLRLFASQVRKALRGARPNLMVLDICGVCNAQCPFCPRVHMPENRAKGFMSDAILETAIREAKLWGINEMRLYATAEPTLHPNFDEYVIRLKSEGFYVSVSTNAYTLHKHSEVLSEIDYLQYSIEGWDKESYEKFRYPLKYSTVKENIEQFWSVISEKPDRPFINCNLLATKEIDIQAFFECWADYVDQVSVSPLMTTTRFSSGKFISEEEVVIGDDYYEFNSNHDLWCSYPFESVTVTFDGKLALCCADFSAELDLGAISDGIGAWQKNPIMKKVRKQFYPFAKKPICYDCNRFCVPTDETIGSLRSMMAKLPKKYADKAKLCY